MLDLYSVRKEADKNEHGCTVGYPIHLLLADAHKAIPLGELQYLLIWYDTEDQQHGQCCITDGCCFGAWKDQEEIPFSKTVSIPIYAHFCFDGVRHIYMPYENYPNFKFLSDALLAIKSHVHDVLDYVKSEAS